MVMKCVLSVCLLTISRLDTQPILLCLQQLLVDSNLHVKSSLYLRKEVQNCMWGPLKSHLPASNSDILPSACWSPSNGGFAAESLLPFPCRTVAWSSWFLWSVGLCVGGGSNFCALLQTFFFGRQSGSPILSIFEPQPYSHPALPIFSWKNPENS